VGARQVRQRILLLVENEPMREMHYEHGKRYEPEMHCEPGKQNEPEKRYEHGHDALCET
jgi:hypothetical protein